MKRHQHRRRRLFGPGEALPFGQHLVIDLHGCNPVTIASRTMIAEYAIRLVDLLGMVAYGDPLIEHFGHADPVTSGYTLVQLIETSSITAHFSEVNLSAHLDVFSCRPFNADAALAFTEHYYGARESTYTVLSR